ncbi:DUF3108 domain-containing protein [Kaistia dalseonensis]|uniref:DUF3108 domain-containing protein n=1 Tax=Kaistia dalseonensis TaxID=410840 RepID=A0ABU0H6Y1_9HYPH|nr:DUF3108 domain-containing protein [Kaistia dalseonensis]MCX5494636.1 DUF3108 domain-containing protein [Kaistia dalseonensis]MDQ0437216.1 hypothetical protein [Kaistia dalseonensis]
MNRIRPSRLLMRTGLAALLGLATASAEARPQTIPNGSLEASYNILLGGLTIGRFKLDTIVDRSEYTVTVRGSTSGVSRFVSDGTGLLKSSGRISGTKLLPNDYYLDTTENGRMSSNVNMRMNAGNIVSVAALPPLMKKADRVPILPRHKHNILDPLSAMIVPLDKDHMSAACNRSIPVFDGWQRFDVKLFYKSTAEVRGENGSYSGPVTVCGARYIALAGHRPTLEAVQFMEQNKDLEVWFAPVEELGVLMPFRMQIGTEVGILTIHASRFVGQGSTQRASAE